MWNVRSCVDIRVIPDIPQPARRLWTVSQVQQGSSPRALRHLGPSPRRTGLTASPLSWGKPGGMLSSMLSRRGLEDTGPGLPGPAATCNGQQLAPVNIPAEAPQPHGKSQQGFVY